MNKKCIKMLFFLILILLFLCITVSIYAHPTNLSVEYDQCKDNDDNKMWYYISSANMPEEHISDAITTIRYYITADDSSVGLVDISTDTLANIKSAFLQSMLSWNNIYYYSYDENGNRIARKIINIIEGNSRYESNILITFCHNRSYFALSTSSGQNPVIPDESESLHKHYDVWCIDVNIDHFYAHGPYRDDNDNWISSKSEKAALICRERTGAHEVGHILGLLDIDKYCGVDSFDGHHNELLMGFGNAEERQTYATYKDIAGVSITRGFHTDDDHRWMIRTKEENGSQYLICSLCNGIRTEYELDEDGTYEGQTPDVYGSCNDDHSLTGGNMLLIATDCVRDFYKCLKCRYIEESEHSHILGEWEQGDNFAHVKSCAVCDYSITEDHSLVGEWMYKDKYSHKKVCEVCEKEILGAHAVRLSEVIGNRAPCRLCEAMIILDDGFGQIIHNVQKVSINGSYILPSGIIVLVDEDVEAYENGTLVFYDKDDLPEM